MVYRLLFLHLIYIIITIKCNTITLRNHNHLPFKMYCVWPYKKTKRIEDNILKSQKQMNVIIQEKLRKYWRTSYEKQGFFSRQETFWIFQRIQYSQRLCSEQAFLFLYQTKFNHEREFALNKNRLTVIFCNHCYLKY